ncbi:hypothetical protein ABBQ32_008019 [Trebouxia sp. C0010 RCD-2024]
MSATEEVHEAETASGAVNQDQPAEATTQASEPAGAAAAEPQAALKPSSDAERKTSDSKPHSPKPKGSPAKAKASELAHSEERPSGRRERKQTAFFQPEKKTETEKLEIREGKGTKLGEIPNVAFHLSKVTGRHELLEDLHQILYGRKGKLTTRKKDIQAFSGFTFADDQEEAEREKAKGLLSRFKNDHMTKLLDLLDIPRSELKDKDARIQRVLEFLEAPSQLSDKDLAAKEAAKKAAGARKRQRKEKNTDKASDQGTDKVKDKKSSDAKPKSSKKAKKSGADDKAEEEQEEEDGEGAAEQDEDDEKPLLAMVPKKESLPSDEDLSKEVVSVLSGVDVLEFNIKMLMKHLNAKYKVDLKDKKPFIKTIAIQYCMEHAPKNAGEGEDESG